MTDEKKTVKEQISELYDRDCYGYMRVVRPEEIFKVVDGLVAELQKRKREGRRGTYTVTYVDKRPPTVYIEIDEVLVLLGVPQGYDAKLPEEK